MNYLYFIFINIICIFLVIADKQFAKKHKRRISEKSFFILSLIGGSVGTYLTMKTIRHKTLHKRFMIGLPLIIILQLGAIFLYYNYII